MATDRARNMHKVPHNKIDHINIGEYGGLKKSKKKKLHGLSPWANYTDRATAAFRRSVANLCG
jgi:hypothetical protein